MLPWGSTGFRSWSSPFLNLHLPFASSKLAFYLFADDTNIYYESEGLAKLQSVVNKELKKVKIWLDVNKLSLNIDKPIL